MALSWATDDPEHAQNRIPTAAKPIQTRVTKRLYYTLVLRVAPHLAGDPEVPVVGG